MTTTTTELAPVSNGGASRLEAAKYLGVSLSTIKRELSEGKLAYTRQRGRVVIPWAVLYARIPPASPTSPAITEAPKDPTP